MVFFSTAGSCASHHRRLRIRYGLWPLTLLLAISAAGAAGFAPPPDARMTPRHGRNFYSGILFLSEHADTLQLAALGFCDFQFDGRVPQAVRYRAAWPVDAPLDSLPSAVSGIDYDRRAPTPLDSVLLEVPHYSIRASEQSASGGIGGLPMSVASFPFPANGQADTLIRGQPLVRGTVLVYADADTTLLKRWGFCQFAAPPYATLRFDDPKLSRLIEAHRIPCYWPLTLEMKALPPQAAQLIADRRQGARKYNTPVHFPEQP